MTPLKTIAHMLASWRRYRQTVRELSEMTDRELNDIGISRSDLDAIARMASSEA